MIRSLISLLCLSVVLAFALAPGGHFGASAAMASPVASEAAGHDGHSHAHDEADAPAAECCSMALGGCFAVDLPPAPHRAERVAIPTGIQPDFGFSMPAGCPRGPEPRPPKV